MQRPMRFSRREISREDAMELLTKGNYGILSTVGSDNAPYGVPLSYTVQDNNVYFHCALEGHKVDNLRHQSEVSFCWVGDASPYCNSETNNFSTTYESVIVSGPAREVTDANEKRDILIALCEKYMPGMLEQATKGAQMHGDKTSVWAIEIKSITGKRNAG